ncbi:MAG: histidine kinase [Bacteroides sp.]|nr:histidine kinase [Bacteroides sp.]
MSLVTDITDSDSEKIGVLEVSVRMDEVIPSLFSDNGSVRSLLLDGSDNVIVGDSEISAEEIAAVPFSEEPLPLTLDGRQVLAVKTRLGKPDCIYLQITDVSDVYATMAWRAFSLFLTFIAAALLMTVTVSGLTRRILRGFYRAFDGIKAFAGGDTEAVVEVTGEGEIADFAREAGALLDQLRRFMKDNLEREIQIQQAETRALQNQINAHFIYNVLEAIKMMAEIDEKYEIADAVTSLGKLLRYGMKLESENVELVRELEYIKNYIDLMNLRFDYVITLDVDMPAELLEQRIPKISLQSIVENAVIYGAASIATDSTVCLRGETDKEHKRFTVSITDEGMGMDESTLQRLKRQILGEEPAQSKSGNGIGLKNVHDRIRLSFGEEYGLRVESRPQLGTTVTANLPYTEPNK